MSSKSLIRRTDALVLLGLAAALVLTPSARGQYTAVFTNPPGALIRMDMRTTVGVELDEIPAGPQREAAAASVFSQDKNF